MTRKYFVTLLAALLAFFQMAGLGVSAASARSKSANTGAPVSPTDESKVPHYFGPYSNWANSPQVLADAIVTISDGGGTGAEATASVDPKTGGIDAITVTSPGSGYTSRPGRRHHCARRDSDRAGERDVDDLRRRRDEHHGRRDRLRLHRPRRHLHRRHRDSTAATLQASGHVDNLTITDGGSGYAIQPIVKFSLPDLPSGMPATGSATMDANGVVTSVDVADPGLGLPHRPDRDHPRRQPGQPDRRHRDSRPSQSTPSTSRRAATVTTPLRP